MQDFKNFSTYQAVNYALKIYFKNWRFFGVIFFIILCITFGFNFFKIPLDTLVFGWPTLSVDKISYKRLLITVSSIFVLLYFAFLNKLFLANYNNQIFKFNRFFDLNSSNLIRYITTSFIYYLGFLVCAAPVLIIGYIANMQSNIWFYQFLILATAFLILILPAIILWSKYIFADYFCLEKNLNIAHNFTASSNLTYGQIPKMVLMFYAIGLILVIAFIAIGALFFFLFISLFSIFSRVISHYNWSNYLVILPLKTFPIFLLYGFIFPVIFLIKLSIYKQLFSNTQKGKT